MKIAIIIVVSILFSACYGEEDDAKKKEKMEKMKEHMKKMEEKCKAERTPEMKEAFDKKQTEQIECIKKNYPEMEETNKICWEKTFSGKPQPKSGSEMFFHMCDNKDEMMKGMEGMFECIGEETVKKHPDIKKEDVKETIQSCKPNKPKSDEKEKDEKKKDEKA